MWPPSLTAICRDARGRNTLRVSLGRGVGSEIGGPAQLVTIEAAVAANLIRLTCLGHLSSPLFASFCVSYPPTLLASSVLDIRFGAYMPMGPEPFLTIDIVTL